VAAIKLRILVNELSNVMLVFDEIKVYRSITDEAGPFVEVTGPGTRLTLVVDVTLYEFIDGSGDPAFWYKFAFYDSGTAAEGSSSEAIQPEGAQGQYCTISDIRDEGVSAAQYSDARVSMAISLASQQIEMFTGRWFEPRSLDFLADGRNARSIHLEQPIIEISNVYVGTVEISLTDLIIYNRHMTGLTNPDDRENPRIELFQTFGYDFASVGGTGCRWFPQGQQNVRVVGTFGYTDYDGTVTGKIPLMIRHACKLIALRELAGAASPDASDVASEWKTAYRKTRDQQVGFFVPTAGSTVRSVIGIFTGDPRIDTILARYRRPSQIRAV